MLIRGASKKFHEELKRSPRLPLRIPPLSEADSPPACYFAVLHLKKEAFPWRILPSPVFGPSPDWSS